MDMGKPVGAIKAFTEGAYKASGKYVLFATDDIQFPTHAIMRAVSHLEETPTCGAVAFAHNKRRNEFKVDYHAVITEQGQRKSYLYPQISLIRKWLGDTCGWWGGRHPIMSKAFTYGGDNFLGANIVEHGYSVDAVLGCNNIESVFDDAPRKMNADKHKADANLYYQCFPNLPTLRNHPTVNNPDSRTLRILYVNHFSKGNVLHHKNKRTLKEAFAKVGIVWEFDYVAYGDKVGQALEDTARSFQPHLIFMQVHRAELINGAVLRNMRKVAPHTVIVNWIGDVYDFLSLNPKQSQAWQELDALLVINANPIEQLAQVGITAFHFAHSYETVDLPLPDMPAHDVVFLGNGYNDTRKQLGKTLKGLPCNVGLYGHGHLVHTDGSTHYDFSKGRALYKRAKIAISDQQFDARKYTSNRFWEIGISGGALILHQHTPGFDELGLIDGEHYIGWNTPKDLQEKIKYWLDKKRDEKRKQIVRNAKALIESEHSFDARVKYLLLEVIPQLAERTKAHELVTA